MRAIMMQFYRSQFSAMRFNSEMGCPFWQAEGGYKAACLSPTDADKDMPQLLLSKWML